MVGPVAGVFPLMPSVRSRLDVDDRLVFEIESRGGDIIAELSPELHKALRAVAETIAVDVSPDCMLVRHVGPGEHLFTQAYVAIWAPNAQAKAEMRGGPVDGEMFTVTRDADGWPRPTIRVAAPSQPIAADYLATEPADVVPSLMPAHPTYRLVGFRNDPAVWVYDLEA